MLGWGLTSDIGLNFSNRVEPEHKSQAHKVFREASQRDFLEIILAAGTANRPQSRAHRLTSTFAACLGVSGMHEAQYAPILLFACIQCFVQICIVEHERLGRQRGVSIPCGARITGARPTKDYAHAMVAS